MTGAVVLLAAVSVGAGEVTIPKGGFKFGDYNLPASVKIKFE